MNFSPEERDAYEDHLKWLRIEANTLKKYEQKGREEGKAELIKMMLNTGNSVDAIAKITGLPVEEIEKLI